MFPLCFGEGMFCWLAELMELFCGVQVKRVDESIVAPKEFDELQGTLIISSIILVQYLQTMF